MATCMLRWRRPMSPDMAGWIVTIVAAVPTLLGAFVVYIRNGIHAEAFTKHAARLLDEGRGHRFEKLLVASRPVPLALLLGAIWQEREAPEGMPSTIARGGYRDAEPLAPPPRRRRAVPKTAPSATPSPPRGASSKRARRCASRATAPRPTGTTRAPATGGPRSGPLPARAPSTTTGPGRCASSKRAATSSRSSPTRPWRRASRPPTK